MGPIPLPARQSLARARDSTPCTGVCVVLVKLKTPELGRAHAQWARSSAPPWASPWAPRSVRRSRLGHGLRGSDETSLAGSAVGSLVDSAVVLLVGSAVGFAVGSTVGSAVAARPWSPRLGRDLARGLGRGLARRLGRGSARGLRIATQVGLVRLPARRTRPAGP